MANGEQTNKSTWVVAGIILVVVVAGIAAQFFSGSKKAPLTLPGKLTPTQVAALKALEARYRQEEMAQPSMLSAEQVTALRRLESSNP